MARLLHSRRLGKPRSRRRSSTLPHFGRALLRRNPTVVLSVDVALRRMPATLLPASAAAAVTAARNMPAVGLTIAHSRRAVVAVSRLESNLACQCRRVTSAAPARFFSAPVAARNGTHVRSSQRPKQLGATTGRAAAKTAERGLRGVVRATRVTAPSGTSTSGSLRSRPRTRVPPFAPTCRSGRLSPRTCQCGPATGILHVGLRRPSSMLPRV